MRPFSLHAGRKGCMKIFIAAHKYQQYSRAFLTQEKAQSYIDEQKFPEAWQIHPCVLDESAVTEIQNVKQLNGEKHEKKNDSSSDDTLDLILSLR